MNSSGVLVDDIGLGLFLAYVFSGGWLVTAWGVVNCLRLMRRPQTRPRGRELLIATLTPITYLAMWWLLSMMQVGLGDTSPWAFWSAAVAGVIILFAGPLAAHRLANRD